MEEERRTAYEILQVREEADQVVLQAAYRALASVYHPDLNASPRAERRMAELNDAYAAVRSPEVRAAYDRPRKTANIPDARAAPAPIVTPPPSRATPGDGSALLDFGRYSGWSLADLARQDPDYLRRLSRHSSGIRYRRGIERVLKDSVRPPAPEQPMGFGIYLSRNAGTNRATSAAWVVDDLDRVMADLRERGVEFQDYDMPELLTVDGIGTSEDGSLSAWFINSEDNTPMIMQPAGAFPG